MIQELQQFSKIFALEENNVKEIVLESVSVLICPIHFISVGYIFNLVKATDTKSSISYLTYFYGFWEGYYWKWKAQGTNQIWDMYSFTDLFI